MEHFFFSGATTTKLDEKNRFVLPQNMRYGLIENGSLEFILGLGLGGSLAIYKRSEIEQIVKRLRPKLHQAKYRKFFTLFFSTLYHTSCDKLGRVLIPSILKRAAKIENEIIVAGVLNKIEIWSREKYEFDLDGFLSCDDNEEGSLFNVTEEIMNPHYSPTQMITPRPDPIKEEIISDDQELAYIRSDGGSDTGIQGI
ncbi:MAG: hypothetical protein P0S95_05790 [Rhabdochlamydiaceae bacterium]|nr:hypothetical protein [Candidatus Amphrikana amoebophyrae]